MMKRFLRSRAGITITAFLFFLYVRVVYATCRISFPQREQFDAILSAGTPVVFAFWHGRMVFLPVINPRRKDTYAMISLHKDGALIARVMDFFRLKHIRGSSNRPASDAKGAKDRGGVQALRNAVRILQQGKSVAITPDGPKGPRMRVQEGIVQIAQMTGVPIMPVSFSCSRARRFHSWDRFLLPCPFGKVFFEMGELIQVPRDLDPEAREKTRKAIENQLNSLTWVADEKAGLSRIEPQ